MTERRKLALVVGGTVPHDAISDAYIRNYEDFSVEYDVTLFARRNEVEGLPVNLVRVEQLLLDRRYLAADIIVFHFGVYYDLFDCITIGNGHAKIVSIFHNVTPKEFVDEAAHPLIDNSMAQVHSLAHSDLVLADSDFNRQTLLSLGIDGRKVQTMPLAVSFPPIVDAKLRAEPVRILFVGRAVRSKGLLEALEAVGAAVSSGFSVEFVIAGNLAFSRADYLENCRLRAVELGIAEHVKFVGTVTAEILEKLYSAADILMMCSYHEGFCVPIVEGLRAACIPVGFAAGNVPSVADGLGRLVEPGNQAELNEALRQVIEDLQRVGSDEVRRLRTDRGSMTNEDWNALRLDSVSKYEPARLRGAKLEALRVLLEGYSPPR
jgi:glycosyltransferase involved in cell wall biosynthesis